jgi:ribosome-binding protein aMBF1 (putative translation factor)
MGRGVVLWPIDTREVSQSLQARFGERVRKLRLARGWTQEEMAERFGIDREYLSHVERGTKNILPAHNGRAGEGI